MEKSQYKEGSTLKLRAESRRPGTQGLYKMDPLLCCPIRRPMVEAYLTLNPLGVPMKSFLAGTLMTMVSSLPLQANPQEQCAFAPTQANETSRMSQTPPPPVPRPTCASCGAKQKADGSISHRSNCPYAPKKKK